jgi:hypothetical protein
VSGAGERGCNTQQLCERPVEEWRGCCLQQRHKDGQRMDQWTLPGQEEPAAKCMKERKSRPGGTCLRSLGPHNCRSASNLRFLRFSKEPKVTGCR